ncbi:SRPBCC family protein [Paraburkholderia sp. MMS20-SJTN17]|uniref:SRPBCC family protein n=1 Tax=Paraburkholderia translucens TaxID=2886945 RepID=A0ABS8KCY2_9BURK|nr:SRPBCC family protein [Paraburkholderia sp. MMS20-SJTN17]MCC8402527.1 SRPBCC family protein [Paraburkholderia sp. MMS20-SJTN17]
MKSPLRWIGAILAALAVLVLLVLPLPGFVNLTTRIVTVVAIERPDTVVFDYVTTPAHWPDWHPSSLSVRGATDHSLRVGEQVTEEFRVAGRRGSVVWTVAERDRPRKWVIVGTIGGKSAGTVSYSLTPVASGTRFEREFIYRAPSLWFEAVNVLFVRARIQQESDTAVARLKKTLETMP